MENFQIKEHFIQTKNGKIYGKLYIPEKAKDAPTLIICHGFTGTYQDNEDYAEHFAEQGYVVFIFDFRGGSLESKSDGKMVEMSVMTEVKDLENVVKNIKKLPCVNPDQIDLIGKSQGGVVSAIFAARHPNEVNKLVLIYPAFVIRDDAHKMLKGLKKEEFPETYKVFDDSSIVGKKYALDIWDYDVYKEIGNYKKPVLILHGNSDQIVPISYSEKAANIYNNVKFITIKNAGHGFGEKYTPLSFKYIDEFLQNKNS